jgi:uncharacterized protein with FMN-binding domain
VSRISVKAVLAKRTAIAATSTAVGVALVIGLHSSKPSRLLASAPASTSRPRGPSATTVPAVTTTPAGPTSSGGGSSATGDLEQYGYGELATKVTMRDGRISDVSVVELQTAEQYSQDLAQQVIPMLRREVLSAQGVRVDVISGATYTSEAYLYSVESALARLRG